MYKKTLIEGSVSHSLWPESFNMKKAVIFEIMQVMIDLRGFLFFISFGL